MPPQKTAADAGLEDVHLLRECLEELRRGEEAADFAVLQNHRGLIHDVRHVLLRHVETACFVISFFTKRGSRSMK